MTQTEALNWTVKMIDADKRGIEKGFNPDNREPYYRGYNQGYIAGLASALEIIDQHRKYFPPDPALYIEPACAECGSPLRSEDVEAGEDTCPDCAAA